jgi:multiple sugar transport system ATP-binding protein
MISEYPSIRVRGLSKRFGRIEALRDISLDVHADELLVVLGPTGAGKTTLLRTIAGLERSDAGTIELGAEDVTHVAPARRDVSLVFQNFSLYPDWSVRRNLEFPLRAPGRNESKTKIRERVESIAGLLQISHLLPRRSSQLSGGEMQRVAIGRAIVRRPRLFLMDEPLTNLDAKLRESLRVELALLRRELKTPMIYVTHDQAEALSMADRIVVLSQGQILQSGTPQEIYERPVSPTVALQLGTPAINVLPASRRGSDLVADDGTVIVRDARASEAQCEIGVRPENIALEGGRYPATVEGVENIGAVRIVLVCWAGRDVRIMTSSSTKIACGDQIYPKIDATRIVIWKTER